MSTDTRPGAPQEISIKPNQFEVSGSGVSTTAITVAVAGAILYLIGTSIFLSLPVGSSYFWLGAAEGLFGVSLFFVSYACYDRARKEHQTRGLPFVESIEQYREMLEEDDGVHYVYREKGFVQDHNAMSAHSDLKAQAILDNVTRLSLCAVDGKRINNTDIEALFGDKMSYATQDITFELYALIRARYLNLGAGVDVTQLPVSGSAKEPILYFDLQSQGKGLAIEVLYALINEDGEAFKYIIGKMKIDFDTGEAKFSWSSPQDERPSFNDRLSS